MTPLIEKLAPEETRTPIQKFYAGENVFVTGSTGFLGRLLLEKLLRACPEIGNIYLLIRNKKGRSLHERIDHLLEDVVFDRLREIDPKFRYKITGIEGDVSLPELGINDQDRRLLINEVSVVFHVAATVNFNEKLKLAVPTNVSGTQYLVKLCNEMVALKAMVHVSTAYSNCIEDVVKERFYPPPMSPDKLVELTAILKEDVQKKITKSLLGEFPNTYTYTKAVGENVILEHGKGLPIVVFRPAIVTSTYKEPVKAWINNFYGPTGVVAGALAGVIRILFCDEDASANIVPADLTVNAMIAAPWDATRRRSRPEVSPARDLGEPPVYNFEMNSQQPIKWRAYLEGVRDYGVNFPTVHAMWYYSFFLTKSPAVHFLALVLLHYLPAFLGDLVLVCMAKKPRFVRFYKKINTFTSVITYFCTKEFKYESNRVRDMIDNMTKEDQSLFFCDLKKVDYDEYFKTYVKGIRTYLLRDPISTLPKALNKWNKLYWLHQTLKGILLVVCLRCIWFVLTFIHKSIT